MILLTLLLLEINPLWKNRIASWRNNLWKIDFIQSAKISDYFPHPNFEFFFLTILKNNTDVLNPSTTPWKMKTVIEIQSINCVHDYNFIPKTAQNPHQIWELLIWGVTFYALIHNSPYHNWDSETGFLRGVGQKTIWKCTSSVSITLIKFVKSPSHFKLFWISELLLVPKNVKRQAPNHLSPLGHIVVAPLRK